MKTYQQAIDEIDFANYYAVELLEGVFGKTKPEDKEILILEENLKRPLFGTFQCRINNSYFPRALIVSSNFVEQNTLSLMLYSKDIQVDRVHTKNDLFEQFGRKSHYGIVIISDKFIDIGICFLTTYFKAMKNRPFLIYLGNDTESYLRFGFDAQLKHPFFTEDLMRILPKLQARI